MHRAMTCVNSQVTRKSRALMLMFERSGVRQGHSNALVAGARPRVDEHEGRSHVAVPHRSLRVLFILGCASCIGCTHMYPIQKTSSAPNEARVVVCKGSGAYASCRAVDSKTYRDAIRTVQARTGTRINPNPVVRRSRTPI